MLTPSTPTEARLKSVSSTHSDDANGNAFYANQLSSVYLVGNEAYPLLNPVTNSPVWFNNNLSAGTNDTLVFDVAGQQGRSQAVWRRVVHRHDDVGI